MTRPYGYHIAERDVEIECAACGRTATIRVRGGRPRRYCERCRPLRGDANLQYNEWLRRLRRAPRGMCRGCGAQLVDPGRGRGRQVWCSERCRGRYRRRHGGSTRAVVMTPSH
ncbi:MAG: hypothetical protein ACREN2_06080 [Candidatus Dormibacteria bacterium]